ncbi:MAG: hypothetical protein E7644_08180 [Ruminococcaceae bacterium]|nr:hypothetical protein [Oscillospiraceae bacterium]
MAGLFAYGGAPNWGLSGCSHELFGKVLVKFFQKLAGHGAEPHTGHFSFGSFSLCASGVKEKSGHEIRKRQMAVAARTFRFLSHFFFAGVSRKEKVIKKKRRFCGRCPHPQTFEKV